MKRTRLYVLEFSVGNGRLAFSFIFTIKWSMSYAATGECHVDLFFKINIENIARKGQHSRIHNKNNTIRHRSIAICVCNILLLFLQGYYNFFIRT